MARPYQAFKVLKRFNKPETAVSLERFVINFEALEGNSPVEILGHYRAGLMRPQSAP
jgi:hypothetical protein